jgi:DNA-binding transcriptional regulator GbsR (MarR family)
MNDLIKKDFIQDFGEAYHMFGLPRLMGRIVGLLLHADDPISLDKISKDLNVSKGPVSQIIKRLRDHNQVKRVWVPGDRKDYYKADHNIFQNSFKSHMNMMHNNLIIAQKYKTLLENKEYVSSRAFETHINQMDIFFQNVMKHYNKLINDWEKMKIDKK